jgi:hypothetical protein
MSEYTPADDESRKLYPEQMFYQFTRPIAQVSHPVCTKYLWIIKTYNVDDSKDLNQVDYKGVMTSYRACRTTHPEFFAEILNLKWHEFTKYSDYYNYCLYCLKHAPAVF